MHLLLKIRFFLLFIVLFSFGFQKIFAQIPNKVTTKSDFVKLKMDSETSLYQPVNKYYEFDNFFYNGLPNWDLSYFAQSGQLSLFSSENDYGRFGFQVASGDINGDGLEDLVVCGALVSFSGRSNCGAAYIFWGALNIEDIIFSGNADVKIYGPNSDSILEGLAVGNVNSDGYDDVVLGATGDDEVYLILGQPAFLNVIDLQNRYDSKMSGNQENQTGASVAMGDINNDGMQDILIAAPAGSDINNSRPYSGVYFLVYGRKNWSNSIDLNSETVILGAEEEDGTKYELVPNYIYGGYDKVRTFYPGMQIISGDVNGDGFDDILIGVPGGDGPENSRNQCGEAYVILGNNALKKNYDLLNEADLVCFGVDVEDHIVRLGTGDVNGDGFDDLLIGARDGDGKNNSLPDAGEIYIVNGRRDFPSDIDLKLQADVTIYGIDKGDILGRMISEDINNDGLSDLFLGSPGADGPNNQRQDCGEAYILYGGDFPSTIDLKTYSHQKIFGANNGDVITGYGAMDINDLNNDGFYDFLIGAVLADGYNNNFADGGEAYVLSGKRLTTNDIDFVLTTILSPIDTVQHLPPSTPKVVIKNIGENRENYSITFKIEDGYNDILTGILSKDEIDTIAFKPWWPSNTGMFNVSSEINAFRDKDITNNFETDSVYVNSNIDGSVQEILSPVDTIKVYPETTLIAVIANVGGGGDTFIVNINIGLEYHETLVVPLDVGQIDTIFFNPWLPSAIGMYEVNFSISSFWDKNLKNNQLTKTIFVKNCDIDAAVSEILSPIGTIRDWLEITPSAIIQNLGTKAENINVFFEIDTMYAERVELTLDSDQTTHVTFPLWSLISVVPGTYQVTCYVNLPNDQNLLNDKKTIIITLPGIDIALLEIISPPNTVEQGKRIIPEVEVLNRGDKTETFGIIFNIDTIYSEILEVTLEAQNQNIIRFPSWLPLHCGTSNVNCKIILNNDAIPSNNVLTKQVLVVRSPDFVIAPNPFTPNGDGYNDYIEFLYPELTNGLSEISIYDVNGKLIRELVELVKWDGKDNYEMLALPGAYFYVVKVQNKIIGKGVLDLAR